MGKLTANLTAKWAYNLQIVRKEGKAFPLYEKAFASGCTTVNPLSAYGVLLMRRGQYNKAVEVLRYTRKLKLKPQQWGTVYANLGLAYWLSGDLDRAVRIYKKLFEKVATSTVYGTLGFLLIAQGDATGDYAEAMDFNQRAYEYDNEDAVILDNMGQLHFRLGEMDKAEEMFVKALEIKPSQFDTLVYLSRIRIGQGREEEAKKMLSTALAKPYSAFNTVKRETALELAQKLGVEVEEV